MTTEASVSSPVQKRNTGRPRPASQVPPHVPALDEAGRVGEVRDAAVVRHRALDRERTVRACREQAAVPARHVRAPRGGLTRTLPSAVVAAVEPDDVEPGVLAADEQVATDHQRCAVPVVVPHDGATRMAVERPEHARPAAVERDDAEAVVARAAVVEGVTVGIGRRRSLGEIACHDGGRSGRPVAPSRKWYARSKAPNRTSTPPRPRDHVGLAGPTDAAPGLRPGSSLEVEQMFPARG